MKIKELNFEQKIQSDLPTVWNFFSRPENLNKLTPKDMHFEILTDVEGVEMYPGMLINYVVSPFPWLKMNWTTEITQIDQHKYFVDEQRFGPYAMWHHEHHFEEVSDGVLMKDKLYYAVGMGPLGRLADALFVNKRVKEIFEYRFEAVEEVF